MIERGVPSKINKYFNKVSKSNGSGHTYEFKSDEQFARVRKFYFILSSKNHVKENGVEIPPSKKYFKYKALSDIIDHYVFKDGLSSEELQKGIKIACLKKKKWLT
jgi:hypothetical protein